MAIDIQIAGPIFYKKQQFVPGNALNVVRLIVNNFIMRQIQIGNTDTLAKINLKDNFIIRIRE